MWPKERKGKGSRSVPAEGKRQKDKKKEMKRGGKKGGGRKLSKFPTEKEEMDLLHLSVEGSGGRVDGG